MMVYRAYHNRDGTARAVDKRINIQVFACDAVSHQLTAVR